MLLLSSVIAPKQIQSSAKDLFQTTDKQPQVLADFLIKNPYIKPEPNFNDQIVKLKSLQDQREQVRQAEIKRLEAEQAERDKITQLQTENQSKVLQSASNSFSDKVLALRNCEAGNDYTKNTGNGYYGAYQYNISTWNNFGGYTRADLAPPAIQDQKFLLDYARRGGSPWPTCSARVGL
jgi:hypothetical protein